MGLGIVAVFILCIFLIILASSGYTGIAIATIILTGMGFIFINAIFKPGIIARVISAIIAIIGLVYILNVMYDPIRNGRPEDLLPTFFIIGLFMIVINLAVVFGIVFLGAWITDINEKNNS